MVFLLPRQTIQGMSYRIERIPASYYYYYYRKPAVRRAEDLVRTNKSFGSSVLFPNNFITLHPYCNNIFYNSYHISYDLFFQSQTWKKQQRLREKETWVSCAPYGVTFIAAGYVSLNYVVGYYDSNGEIVWYC